MRASAPPPPPPLTYIICLSLEQSIIGPRSGKWKEEERSADKFSCLAAAVSSCFVRLGFSLFFLDRGGVRWTGPFHAAGRVGVWV